MQEYHQMKNSSLMFSIIIFLVNKYKKKYNGIYLLDVLEHISKNNENKFLKNIVYSLEKKWNFNYRYSVVRISKIFEK